MTATSCPKLTVSYNYNKKNNSLDLTLTQESAMKDFFLFRKYVKDNLDSEELLTKPFLREDPLNISPDHDSIKSALK